MIQDILRDVVDLHVHGAPDLAPRQHTDLDLVRRAQQQGMRAVVLKSHVESTVGRASIASAATGMAVFGGLALNQFVSGGINPDAVAVSLELGARVIWLPSLGSEAHRSRFPRVADDWRSVRDHPAAIPDTVPGLSIERADIRAAVDQVCRLVAQHDALLATGHLGTAEVATVASSAARRRAKILVTHPDYVVPAMSIDEQRALGREYPSLLFERAAYVVSPGSPEPRPLRVVADAIRATGVDRSVLSSDLGQPNNPEYPEGLAEFLTRLHAEEDFPLDDIRLMACRVPSELLGIA